MTYKRNQDILIENLGSHLSEAILYGKLVKYKKLDEILGCFIPNLPREINIFIDLNQILLELYKFENIANPLGILASITNLPIHYRHYFNKLGIKSNIFLIYSSNDSSNNYKYIANYNAKERILKESNKHVHDIIIYNIELLNTLVPYLPGIYLKRGTVEPTVIAYDLIQKFEKSVSTNIFLSSSDYAYQLPAVLPNVLLIYKKSVLGEDRKSEDISFGVTQANVLSTYIMINNKQSYLNIKNQELVSSFMVCNGLPSRGIKTLLSYKKSLNVLSKLIESYKIISPENIYQIINSFYNEKGITLEEICSRYYAIDINHQLTLYRQLPESMESNFLVDIYDLQALYDINNIYFKGSNMIDFYKL